MPNLPNSAAAAIQPLSPPSTESLALLVCRHSAAAQPGQAESRTTPASSPVSKGHGAALNPLPACPLRSAGDRFCTPASPYHSPRAMPYPGVLAPRRGHRGSFSRQCRSESERKCDQSPVALTTSSSRSAPQHSPSLPGHHHGARVTLPTLPPGAGSASMRKAPLLSATKAGSAAAQNRLLLIDPASQRKSKRRVQQARSNAGQLPPSGPPAQRTPPALDRQAAEARGEPHPQPTG